MRQDIVPDLGKSRFEFSLVISLEIEPTPLFCGLLEQRLAGVKTDRVGDEIVFGFAAVKLIDIGPKINVIQRCRHTDKRVVTGRAVVAQRRRGIAPAPAISQQYEEIFLAPVAYWGRRGRTPPALVGPARQNFIQGICARCIIGMQYQIPPVLAIGSAVCRCTVSRIGCATEAHQIAAHVLQGPDQWRAPSRRETVDRLIDECTVGIEIDDRLIEFTAKVVAAE